MTALFKKMFGTQDDFQTRMRVHELRQEGMACGKKGDYTDGPTGVLTQVKLNDPGLVVFPSAEFMREKFMNTTRPYELEIAKQKEIDTYFPAEEREQVGALLFYARWWNQEVWNWKTEEWDGI